MRILIAESDPKRLDEYKRILEKDKYEILTAANRVEASLAYMETKGKIDVVVFNLRMPGEIEKLVERYKTPRVAISDSEEREKVFSRIDSIRKFDEYNLRYAVRMAAGELELAVA